MNWVAGELIVINVGKFIANFKIVSDAMCGCVFDRMRTKAPLVHIGN